MAGYESNPNTRDLLDMLALSHVPRWCIVPMTRPQTVAEHSYRVAIMVSWMLGMGLDCLTLTRALSHDVEEARTGDIPGPTKRILSSDIYGDGWPENILGWEDEQYELWALTPKTVRPDHLLVLKLADLLETYTYLHAWGRECDHRTRVLTELWREIDEVAGKMDKTKLPCTRAQSWYGVARMVRDAVVYEAR